MVPKSIMIVDDDKNDRFFFRTSLEEIDPSINCIEARNGFVAIAHLQNTILLPDFIFLDENMPGMNGAECLSQLKQDIRLKNIPIIMYSGSFNPNAAAENSEAGADYFLSKPDDFTELPDAIKKAMEIVHANAVY
jgi:CheY-like chemotaxis protein